MISMSHKDLFGRSIQFFSMDSLVMLLYSVRKYITGRSIFTTLFWCKNTFPSSINTLCSDINSPVNLFYQYVGAPTNGEL